MEENATDENSSIHFVPILEDKLMSLKTNSPEVAEKENAPEEPTPVLPTHNGEVSEMKTPEPTAEPEKPPEETKKPDPVEEKKVPRRRSSIGAMRIANAFIAPGTEFTMSPIEIKPKPPKLVRPKRSVQLKIQPVPVARPVRAAPPHSIRYSFDLGERVAIKSCLKSSKSSSAPVSKSLAKQAADKIIGKYRRSGGFIHMRTPVNKQRSKLKFHNICSIRVITPRPGYNPDKLELPYSDDEADMSNPNRERLSTVELQLTPTSQSQLVGLREGGVVQFNASMVFGDGESFVLPTTSSSPSEADIATIEDPETIATTSSTSEIDSVPKVIEKKKRTYRRKSLILGAASPMKSPAKIEKPRFEENDFEISTESTSEPPRRSRRSVRLNKHDIIEQSSKEPDVVLQEREEISQKKRGLVQEEASIEPNAKRSRRKSGFIKNDDEAAAVEKKKETEKRSTIHPFFAPKKVEERAQVAVEAKKNKKPKSSEKSEKVEKPEKSEKPKKPEEKEKVRKRTRRSSAYFGVAKDDTDFIKSSDDIIVLDNIKPSTSFEKMPEVVTEVVTETTVIASSSSSSSLIVSSIEKVVNIPNSPKLGNLASIFIRSPAQPKKVLEVKESEASTSNFQSPTAPSTPKSSFKLFSLFSPKQKPKPDSSTEGTITISDSPIAPPPTPRELFKCPQKPVGVKRQEHWGDRHPETYEFILKMPIQESIFEETNSSDDPIFKTRSFDESILNVDNINSNLRELDSEDPNILIMKKGKVRIEKLETPEGSHPTSIYPPAMEHLVEGADEKEAIQGWLKRWKRRVRKDRERELQREKDRRKSGAKKGRKKKDEEESEDEYEMEGDDLENPLVLMGPTGVGKTALVKALAKQENMRIIWVGPETDRSGAEIKRQLFEALRSHRVDQQPAQALSAFFKTVSQTTFVPKDEEKPKEFVQSLVVFEHVDVFFDTFDRHGVNGLLEVINDSAVPVVFTCENDWPRRNGQIELKRRYLEIRLGRNQDKIQKYVQQVIQSCRNVSINESTIRQLSESVNHDLRALLHQAHFFSLAHKKPFPLSSRHLVSNGFEVEWEKPRISLRNEDENERLEHLMDMYSEVLPDGFINPIYPRIERSWDLERRKLASRQSGPLEALQNAYEALKGRYSKRDLSIEVLPLLVPIDRVERHKKANNRRHLHRFKTHSEKIETDGDSLINAVGKWRFPKDLLSSL